jgi:hypothetical protein
MKNLKVFFTKDYDRESKGVEVFINGTLIAKGHLNLCSNWASVCVLDEHKKDFQRFEHDIEIAIERRNILENRILIK